MPDNKSLGEYTLLELLKMAGQGTVKGVKKGAKVTGKAVMDYSPLVMLAKMIGGATATNPLTTPVKDVGQNILHGLTMDIAPEVLKGRIKKNLEKVDTMELAETIGNIQQSDEELQTQKNQDSINPLSASNPSAGLTSANPSADVGNMSAGTDTGIMETLSGDNPNAGMSSTNTGSNAPAGKKGYGWPVALMMLGKGLQGGNPMDVLSELMANERLSKSQGFEMQKLGKTQEFDMQKLEAEYGYRLRNELLKPNTSGNEDAAAMNLFQQDLVGMIEAFEQIPMKGNKLAGATGALASPIWGREARAKYQTKARSFGYSYGAIVWGQQGRALDARENKILEEITNFRTTQTRGEILGKMQALIDATNSRARQQGLPELPDARILVSQIKNNKSQSVSNAPKVTGFKIKE